MLSPHLDPVEPSRVISPLLLDLKATVLDKTGQASATKFIERVGSNHIVAIARKTVRYERIRARAGCTIAPNASVLPVLHSNIVELDSLSSGRDSTFSVTSPLVTL